MHAKQQYQIETRHPAGYMDGTHFVTVTTETNGSRYVDGRGFGCSRDYPVTSDKTAIVMLLRENGMSLLSIKKAK